MKRAAAKCRDESCPHWFIPPRRTRRARRNRSTKHLMTSFSQVLLNRGNSIARPITRLERSSNSIFVLFVSFVVSLCCFLLPNYQGNLPAMNDGLPITRHYFVRPVAAGQVDRLFWRSLSMQGNNIRPTTFFCIRHSEKRNGKRHFGSSARSRLKVKL